MKVQCTVFNNTYSYGEQNTEMSDEKDQVILHACFLFISNQLLNFRKSFVIFNNQISFIVCLCVRVQKDFLRTTSVTSKIVMVFLKQVMKFTFYFSSQFLKVSLTQNRQFCHVHDVCHSKLEMKLL